MKKTLHLVGKCWVCMIKELTEQVYFKTAYSDQKGRKKSTCHCMGSGSLNLWISFHIPDL